MLPIVPAVLNGSPARDGGCGLKHVVGSLKSIAAQGSPARDGGCGLKLSHQTSDAQWDLGFTRQRWRVRIETSSSWRIWVSTQGSPARDGGCGLKRCSLQSSSVLGYGSPARDGGCGLKRWRLASRPVAWRGSPARDGGCGLKQYKNIVAVADALVHPPEMAGAD